VSPPQRCTLRQCIAPKIIEKGGQLSPRYQHDEQRDNRQAPPDQLPAPRNGFDQLGVGAKMVIADPNSEVNRFSCSVCARGQITAP